MPRARKFTGATDRAARQIGQKIPEDLLLAQLKKSNRKLLSLN
jgi:hypothetical protein